MLLCVSVDRPVTSVTVKSEIYISVLSTPVKVVTFPIIFILCIPITGTPVAQWLRCCATNWKVAGSIPDGVIGIFH